MPATLLTLDPTIQRDIDRILAYAKANPTSEVQLRALVAGDRPSADQYPEYQFVWPIGFRCVFNYEHQPGIGLCRHLSVQVYDKSNPEPQVPAPHTMNRIAEAFGFVQGRLEHYWIDPKTKAFNMVQAVTKCEACEGKGKCDHKDGDQEWSWGCAHCAGTGYRL
jgi:hypothetical protein